MFNIRAETVSEAEETSIHAFRVEAMWWHAHGPACTYTPCHHSQAEVRGEATLCCTSFLSFGEQKL